MNEFCTDVPSVFDAPMFVGLLVDDQLLRELQLALREVRFA